MAATSRLQSICTRFITDTIGDMNLLTKLSGIRYGQKKQTRPNDIDLLIEIKQFLTKKGISTHLEWYVLFDKETHRSVGGCKTVTKEEAEYYLIKNPDICWIDKNDLHVIEVDGAAHDHYVAKTDIRNQLYRDAGINLVVLNLAEIKDRGMTPTEFLEELLF